MKTFNKILLGLFAIAFILFLILLDFYILRRPEPEKPLLYTSTWTKAICYKNYCRDYLITCNSTGFVNLEPISECIYLGENWTDVRPLEWRERWC